MVRQSNAANARWSLRETDPLGLGSAIAPGPRYRSKST
jgi:hypothetical protein